MLGSASLRAAEEGRAVVAETDLAAEVRIVIRTIEALLGDFERGTLTRRQLALSLADRTL